MSSVCIVTGSTSTNLYNQYYFSIHNCYRTYSCISAAETL